MDLQPTASTTFRRSLRDHGQGHETSPRVIARKRGSRRRRIQNCGLKGCLDAESASHPKSWKRFGSRNAHTCAFSRRMSPRVFFPTRSSRGKKHSPRSTRTPGQDPDSHLETIQRGDHSRTGQPQEVALPKRNRQDRRSDGGNRRQHP